MVQDAPAAEWRVSSTHSIDGGIVSAKTAAGVSPSHHRRRRDESSSQTDDGGAQAQHEGNRKPSPQASPATKPQAPSSTGAAAAVDGLDDDVGTVGATLSRDSSAGATVLTPPKRESPGSSSNDSSGSSGASSRRLAADGIECEDVKISNPTNPTSQDDSCSKMTAATAAAAAPAETGEDDEYNHHPTSRTTASGATRPKSTIPGKSRRRRYDGIRVSTQQLSRRSFDGRRRPMTNQAREEMTRIPPFPMPSNAQNGADEDDDGAVIFKSLSSGDELDGSAYQYTLNDKDQDGASSDDSSEGSESTSNSRLDRLLDKYFPDEMGGQGTVRSAPSSPRKQGTSGGNGNPAGAAGSGAAVASPHRESQRVWAGRALSNPILRGGNVLTLSSTQTLPDASEEGAKSPETGLQGLPLLDGAPPIPLSMKSSSAVRLTPRRPSHTRTTTSMSDGDGRHHTFIRSASPKAAVVKTSSLLELTRSMSEGSVLDHPIHHSLSHDLSPRRTCFPRTHSASAVQEWAVCGGMEKSPRRMSAGCCDSGKFNGDLRSLLVGYVPDFCVGTVDDENMTGGGKDGDNKDDAESNEADKVESIRQLSPTSQLASSPDSHGSRQHRTHRNNRSSMSLGMSLWLEDVHRQHQVKEQNRCRMIAAMAKAARAHSQLVSLNDHDSYDNNDRDLASRSFEFDDLGQLGGFNIKRGSKIERKRFNPSSPVIASGIIQRRGHYHDNDSSASSLNSNGNASDPDSDDELTDELLAERDLARRARQMREEIRRAEMEELAREAERAAEAGEEKFVGAASTFDVVLAASAIVSKQTEEENAPMASWRSGEPVPDQRRPWECMFDPSMVEKKSVDLEPPSSPMNEWMKNTLSAPPSSPMVGWVSSAIAMYDPTTTPSQNKRGNNNTLGKSIHHSPTISSRASVPKSVKRRSNSFSDSYHPTTPLRRAATSRTETAITGSSLISALSTPLSDRKRIEKVPVLELRSIEDIVPNFGDIHLRLRTDMAGKGVKKEILGGPSVNRRKGAASDHRSAIGSDGSGSSFQHIAASLGNLLKSAAFSSGQRSIRSLSDVGDGTISEASAASPSSRRLPPPARRPPSRNNTAELSTRHIARLTGMSLDCTRAMRAESEKDARSVLREQLGDLSDSDIGDDDSVASHDTSSTTDLYVSALTNELHTPRNAVRKQRKLFADSPRIPPPIDDLASMAPISNPDPLSTPDQKNTKSPVVGPPIDDLAIPDAVLSVNTPMGGKRIFSRTDEGGIVESKSTEQSPTSHHTDDLTLPDLAYSRSYDVDCHNGSAENSGAASRFSDPLSERRTMLAAMELVSKEKNESTPKRLARPNFSRPDNGDQDGSAIVPVALGDNNTGNEKSGEEGNDVQTCKPTPPAVDEAPSYSFDADNMYWDSDVDSEGSPGGLKKDTCRRSPPTTEVQR